MTESWKSDGAHPVAQSLHDLGSALWFGGAVMGVAGVNKSGADLSQGIDRIRVANSAWSRFGPVEWAGILAAVASGAKLTAVDSPRIAAQRGMAGLSAAKTAAIALGIASTAWATYTGSKVGKVAEEVNRRGDEVAVKDASIPTEKTPPELAKWQGRQRTAQYLVPVFAGANIAFSSYLSQSFRPSATAKGVLGRLLPV